MQKTPLEGAIEKAGGTAEMAKMLGISSQAISQWVRVPVNRVLAVEALTQVPRHELRPDVYPE